MTETSQETDATMERIETIPDDLTCEQILEQPAERDPSTTQAQINNEGHQDDSDADELFDAQLAEFKKGLFMEAITFFGNKMRPNVSKKWLKNVRECIKRLDEAIAAKAQHSSAN